MIGRNLVLFFFMSFILYINTNGQQDSLKEMSVIELQDSIKSGNGLVILDVRTPEELVGPLGQIEGVINIPVQELKDRMTELEKFKGNNIAVICRSGRRSAMATLLLRLNGFDARNVTGGMIKYRELENDNK